MSEPTSEGIDHALETLAAIARIESLQEGVVAVDLPHLERGEWYDRETWRGLGCLDHLPAEVPHGWQDDALLREAYLLELTHALESTRFELFSFGQVIGGKQGLEAALELGGESLAAVEGHLVALERMPVS